MCLRICGVCVSDSGVVCGVRQVMRADREADTHWTETARAGEQHSQSADTSHT